MPVTSEYRSEGRELRRVGRIPTMRSLRELLVERGMVEAIVARPGWAPVLRARGAGGCGPRMTAAE